MDAYVIPIALLIYSPPFIPHESLVGDLGFLVPSSKIVDWRTSLAFLNCGASFLSPRSGFVFELRREETILDIDELGGSMTHVYSLGYLRVVLNSHIAYSWSPPSVRGFA